MKKEKNNGKKGLYRRFLAVLFGIYMFLLIYFVLFSERYGRSGYFEIRQYNLIPFHEIHRFLTYTNSLKLEQILINLIGNILIFSPFGFCIPLFRKKKRATFLSVTFLSLLLSLFIETMQFITKAGVFDVDDLMLNTVGGMIGYFIYLMVQKVFRRKNEYDKV